jgi:superfamily I DNA/RNA helicase/RecB family exonuclease
VADTLFDVEDLDGAATSAPATNPQEVRIGPQDWDQALLPTGTPRIVVGGPGTGKTEFLVRTVVRAARDDEVRPERILVLGFSRRGVDDFRSRLVATLGTAAHRVTMATSHSLAMRLVEANAQVLGWDGPPALLTGTEQERVVRELIADEDPMVWPVAFRSFLSSEAMVAEVTDFILRAREQMVDRDSIARSGRADWRPLPGFLERYEHALRTSGRIDYGFLLTEALRLETIDPDALASFDVVVADEYQDTAPIQAALLMACARNAAEFVVGADPYQSIYSFRGANVENVFSFPNDVRQVLGRPVERLILDTSFRVPSEILAAAVAVTARELPGGAGRVATTRNGGTVACHTFGTLGDEAEWIASDIERIHLVDRIPLERIAVFVRAHGPFVDDLARALDRRSIDHSHADDRLLDEPIIRFLHDLVRVTSGSDIAEAAMRRVLLGPFVGLGHGVVTTLPESPSEWPGWIRARTSHEHHPLAALIEDTAWCHQVDAPTGLWRVWSTLPVMAKVALDADAVRDRRAWSSYAQAMMRAVERDATSTLADQLELADDVDFEVDTLFDVHEGGVAIATLHRSKGTEFDVVYVADAVEGSLPDLRHRDSMLGVRHLNPHLPTATAEYVTFRLDEERRLAYTAMTRSTSRVVWSATVPTDRGGGTSPSRFMRLVAPITDPAAPAGPLTPRALLAHLRREVADPLADPIRRLAGVTFLAGRGAGIADPLDRYGTRLRGPDIGTVDAPIRLSPTQATSYAACPRKYAIERFLMTVDQDSPYLLLGKLVHDVLEGAEREALEAGVERSTYRQAARWLEHLFPESGFADDNVGRAWKQRALATLSTLYELWPSSARPVALETTLEMNLEGWSWSGRADRVEQHGDALTIVDYKTSASAVTKDDAAGSLQLGYYVLAARESLADLGVVTGATFWYPAAPPTKSAIATRDFDMARIDDVRAQLIDIAEAIDAERLPATPNKDCGRCAVSVVCPAVHQGREAFAP